MGNHRPSQERHVSDHLEHLTDTLDAAFAELDEPDQPTTPPSRSRGLLADQRGLTMKVVERDGVLMIDDGVGVPGAVYRSRDEDVRWQRDLTRLEGNEITGYLEKLDRVLAPGRGLSRFEDDTWHPMEGLPGSGRFLLVVHGTFSNTENVWNGISGNNDAQEFVDWATNEYDAIVGFDHATLGLSPMLNANDLAKHIGASEGEIDVITHSRGGLVTRWWLEAFDDADPETRRVVFIGSPLAGTGLAAPPRIRATLGLLTNIADALGTAAAMFPITTAVAGIFKVVGSITSLAANTPTVDAAVSMVPGLAAQSRVGNNHELNEQREYVGPWRDRYFAVQSNFESDDPGWRFWRHFRAGALVDRAADIVFDGQNDLVVDTGSMSEFTESLRLPEDQILDFGTNDRVHHVNYFQQPETLAFIRGKLGR
jgi:hypothetical protein